MQDEEQAESWMTWVVTESLVRTRKTGTGVGLKGRESKEEE